MPPKRGTPTSRGGPSGRGTTATKQPSAGPRSHVHGAGVVPPRGGARTRATATAARGRGAATSTTPRGRGATASRGGKSSAGRGAMEKSGAGKTANDTGKQAAVPTKKAWTEQDEAARKIQCAVRVHFARRRREQLQKAKADYEEEIEKIQREAWLQMVKREQAEAERQAQIQEEVKRKRREDQKRKKRILEAAFDGEDEEVIAVLKEVSEVARTASKSKGDLPPALVENFITHHRSVMADCTDANGNTPLSEAAAGGHPSTICILLEEGAEPNSKGAFDKTPLYRASFAGHKEAVQILLEHGADPRIFGGDGATPSQVACNDDIKEVIDSWDVAQTEKSLAKLEEEREKKAKERKDILKAETNKLSSDVSEAQKEHSRWQRELAKAYEELNKRIYEHDKCVASGNEHRDITLQVVKDAEDHLEVTKMKAEAAHDKLRQVQLLLREKQQGEEEGDQNLVGVKVNFRELDEVLIRDVGDKIKTSGKWPLIIDESRRVATFLRYRDTNFINTLSSKHMEPEFIRLAVLGALRFGKPVVIDMMEVDMWDVLPIKFNAVQQGLLSAIMDKSILQEKVYEKLIRKVDGPEYERNSFMRRRTDEFRLFLITQQRHPAEELLQETYPLRVVLTMQN